MRGRDLTHQTLLGTDLRECRLFGVDITLNCATFDGLLLDDETVALLLGMVSLASLSDGWSHGLLALIERQLGPDRFHAVQRYLAIAE